MRRSAQTPDQMQILPLSVGICLVLAWGPSPHAAEPVPLVRADATFCAGTADELAQVIDGVEAGPHGWSVTPRISEPQALVVRCAQSVEAAELDITLFFLSGRPNNSIAEFALDYTTDAEPSLQGNWKPLEIQRFTAEVATLQRTTNGHLRAALLPDEITGLIPDDTYRIAVLLPNGRATGFRLQVFPVFAYAGGPPWMSWGSPHDFVLTEFRVEVHARENTNIALHRPVKASHPLSGRMLPNALTDGLPATIAHPRDSGLGTNFHFEIDLGRVATLDHIGLRTRGDGYIDRFSRMIVRLYEQDPETGLAPVWEGMARADGSHPEAGTADIIHADLGRGVFRGRYLRLSSDSKVPSSPQLAEVEVYETRTPEVVSARADGRDIPVSGGLDLAPGVRRLSLRLRIPQIGLPPGVAFRWRTRGDLEEWQSSRLMTIDMPCPPAGKTVFEAQALHSDNQWDTTIYRLPIIARQHFWETRLFQWLAGAGSLAAVVGTVLVWARRRTARQVALMKAQTALAEERARIARDLHDDLGANLARIGVLTELVERSINDPENARRQLAKIDSAAHDLTRQLDSVVWAVDPANDTLESLARYLHGQAEEYLGLAGIRCHFTNTEAMPAVSLSSTFRHHLLMIAREALHNVVSHAAANVVTVCIAVQGDQLRIEIADNGRGMPPAAALKPGNGLENMKSRTASLGGVCEFLPPGSGTGTVVRLTIPLPSIPQA
jgi:signal transduction histidine kinase